MEGRMISIHLEEYINLKKKEVENKYLVERNNKLNHDVETLNKEVNGLKDRIVMYETKINEINSMIIRNQLNCIHNLNSEHSNSSTSLSVTSNFINELEQMTTNFTDE